MLSSWIRQIRRKNDTVPDLPLGRIFAQGSRSRVEVDGIKGETINLDFEENRPKRKLLRIAVLTTAIGLSTWGLYSTLTDSKNESNSSIETINKQKSTNESFFSFSYFIDTKNTVLDKFKSIVLSDEERLYLSKKNSLDSKLNKSINLTSNADEKLFNRCLDTFKVRYEGEFDLNNDGIFENVIVYNGGEGYVVYKNGIEKSISAFELEQFFIGSVFEKKDISKYFMAPDNLPRYRDFISNSHVASLQKKDSFYVERLRELGKATGIYTRTEGENLGTDKIFEEKFKNFKEMARF